MESPIQNDQEQNEPKTNQQQEFITNSEYNSPQINDFELGNSDQQVPGESLRDQSAHHSESLKEENVQFNCQKPDSNVLENDECDFKEELEAPVKQSYASGDFDKESGENRVSEGNQLTLEEKKVKYYQEIFEIFDDEFVPENKRLDVQFLKQLQRQTASPAYKPGIKTQDLFQKPKNEQKSDISRPSTRNFFTKNELMVKRSPNLIDFSQIEQKLMSFTKNQPLRNYQETLTNRKQIKILQNSELFEGANSFSKDKSSQLKLENSPQNTKFNRVLSFFGKKQEPQSDQGLKSSGLQRVKQNNVNQNNNKNLDNFLNQIDYVKTMKNNHTSTVNNIFSNPTQTQRNSQQNSLKHTLKQLNKIQLKKNSQSSLKA